MSQEKIQEQRILTELQSSSEKTVLAAIDKLRKHGTPKTFKQMMQLLRDTDEPAVEAAIIQFLYDLKDESSIPILINALNDPTMKYYHSFLVATFWQSALDGSGHLSLFVKKAISGDYTTCLEALTVIESFDASFNQQEITECEAALAEAIEIEKNKEKKKLLQSLHEVVSQLPIEGE
jgi:hypothetical protein